MPTKWEGTNEDLRKLVQSSYAFSSPMESSLCAEWHFVWNGGNQRAPDNCKILVPNYSSQATRAGYGRSDSVRPGCLGSEHEL